MEISEHRFIKCLENVTECGYLHGIYDETIRQVVEDEYDMSLPVEVSQLICTLAHNNCELREIIKTKLIDEYYYNHFYGFKSSNYRKVRISHAITNGFIIADYTLSAIQSLLGSNAANVSMSYLTILLNMIYSYYFRPKIDQIIKMQRKFEKYKKTNYQTNVDLCYMKYSIGSWTKRKFYNDASSMTFLVNTQYFKFPSIVAITIRIYMLFFVYGIHWINCIEFFNPEGDSFINTAYGNLKFWNRHSKMIIDPHNNSIIILSLQWVCSMISLQVKRYDILTAKISRLYFIGAIFSFFSLSCNILPSGSEKKWNCLLIKKFATVAKVLSVILYGMGHSIHLGYFTVYDMPQNPVHETSAHRLWNLETLVNAPRDIFDWIYAIARKYWLGKRILHESTHHVDQTEELYING